jgi:hypothetical protein
MATIGDEITATLQDLQIVAAGDAPSAEDSALALSRVNDFIDGLANERLTLYTITRTTWTIVASTTSYTIGTGATVNVARPTGPEQIENIGYIDTSQDPDLEILFGRPLSELAYQRIPQKALTSTLPQAWYYNPTLTTGTLIPWPVPTSTTLLGVMYAPAPISEFTSLSTTISLPPGYRKFLRAQLRKEIAPAFERPVTPQMERDAIQTMQAVKRANTRERDLILDPMVCGFGVYDIGSDVNR